MVLQSKGIGLGIFILNFIQALLGDVFSMPRETLLTVANFLLAFFFLLGIRMAALLLWLLFVAVHTMLPSPYSQQPSV